MTRPVHIVAVSARTPLGLAAESSAAAMRARISRLTLHPFLVDPTGEPLRCGRDALLDPALLGAARIQALAVAALAELVAKLTRRAALSGPLDVAVALPEARPGFTVAQRDSLVHRLQTRGLDGAERLTLRALGEGHAGALHALAAGARAIADGRSELCIVGGADSYLDADTLDWLDAEKRLAHAGVRGGFPPGEAASFVALASEAKRQQLGLPTLARVRGSSIATETRSWESDEGLLGEGLTQAILHAAEGLRLPDERVGDVYCDINGERLRTDDWGLAIMRTQHMLRDATTYTTGVSEWGDTGAATGALGCVLAVQSWKRGYAHASWALVWGTSWAGLRAACVLEQGDR